MDETVKSSFKYHNILELKEAYKRGENITELLRKNLGKSENTSDIIEIAYDLQSGSYVEYAESQQEKLSAYAAEVSDILDNHLDVGDTMLDVGTGEMTTLAALLSALKIKPSRTFALDISWSRLSVGTAYLDQKYQNILENLHPFVADIKAIPLPDNSIDIVTSSHALEPNGGQLTQLLNELFRVTRKKLVLFEPGYEFASQEGKDRMDRLGYIKNMAGSVEELGGTLVDSFLIKNIAREINPTACYIIEPPKSQSTVRKNADTLFSVPGTSHPLAKHSGFYHSRHTGLGYPILESIPVLKDDASILMTAFNT